MAGTNSPWHDVDFDTDAPIDEATLDVVLALQSDFEEALQVSNNDEDGYLELRIVLQRMIEALNLAETEYQASIQDPTEDTREQHRIGQIAHVFDNEFSDDFFKLLLTQMRSRAPSLIVLCIKMLRLIYTILPELIGRQEDDIFELCDILTAIIVQDDVSSLAPLEVAHPIDIERLFPTMPILEESMKLELRLEATRFMALLLDDNQLSHHVIGTVLLNVLLDRLSQFVRTNWPPVVDVQEASGVFPAAAADGDPSPTSRSIGGVKRRRLSRSENENFQDVKRVRLSMERLPNVTLDQLPIDANAPVTSRIPDEEVEFILQSCAALCDFTEASGAIFSHGTLDSLLVLMRSFYAKVPSPLIRNRQFQTLCLLCSLLSHRKIALEFVSRGGVRLLLSLPRVPFAAHGFANCLCALASLPSVMERVCLLSNSTVKSLVGMGLWLMGNTYNNARHHGALFFSIAFEFRTILEIFDSFGGLRVILNLLTMKEITEDLDMGARQMCHHGAAALRQYFRAHLNVVATESKRRLARRFAREIPQPQPAYKAVTLDTNSTHENVKTVREAMSQDACPFGSGPAQETQWKPVDDFINYGALNVVFRLAKVSKTWRSADIACLALDTLVILTLVPSVHVLLNEVETVTLPSATAAGAAINAAPAATAAIAIPPLPAVTFNNAGPVLATAAMLTAPNAPAPPALRNAAALAGPTAYPIAQSPNGSMAGQRRDTVQRAGLVLILQAAEGKLTSDTDTRKAALQIIVNCVCRERLGGAGLLTQGGAGNLGLMRGQQLRPALVRPAVPALSAPGQLGDEVLRVMWDAFRLSNGIRTLLNLLKERTPVTHADEIRMLACRVLCGLAREPNILQILGKLQVPTTLSELMREPVLPDNRAIHEKFRFHASNLITFVTGRPHFHMPTETLSSLEREAVVANTPVNYDPSELLQLIHAHLRQHGLLETAETLRRESQLELPLVPLPLRLNDFNLPSPPAAPCSSAVATPLNSTPSTPVKAIVPTPSHDNRSVSVETVRVLAESVPGFSGASTSVASFTTPPSLGRLKPKQLRIVSLKGTLGTSSSPNAALPSTHTPTTTAAAAVKGVNNATAPPVSTSSAPALTPLLLPLRLASRMSSTPHLHSHPSSQSQHATPAPTMVPHKWGDSSGQMFSRCVSEALQPNTLDRIVTQYLRDQHTHCAHPVQVLPPMSLLSPHQCPVPTQKQHAPVTTCKRLMNREYIGGHGGRGGAQLDRRFIYSKFRPMRICRPEHSRITCAEFMGDQGEQVVVGTQSGEVKIFDTSSGRETGSYRCHDTDLWSVRPSRDWKSLLVSSQWGPDGSTLWALDEMTTPLLKFPDDRVCLFSHSNDLIVGTADAAAHIYDTRTGARILELYDPANANMYKNNCARFSPNDDLVLSDGILWDCRRGLKIHKFDKFNNYGACKFHPNNLEIVINSEVWDMRTFKLLRTLPALDQCQITFNSLGDVIFGVVRQYEDENYRRPRNPFGSSFRTYDGIDYSPIATIDLERPILDIAVDAIDSHVAVVEQSGHSNIGLQLESVCRLYEIGRRRPQLEDEDDEDEGDDGLGSTSNSLESDGDDDDDEDGDGNGGDDDDSLSAADGLADLLFGDSEPDFDEDEEDEEDEEEADDGADVAEDDEDDDGDDDGGIEIFIEGDEDEDEDDDEDEEDD